MPNPLYSFLIGIPGSGKSTFARKLAAANPHSYLIATDAIRAKLYGDEAIQGDWLRVWSEVKYQFEFAYQQKKSVIYDATNFHPLYRQELITTVRQIGFPSMTAIWLKTPIWLCLARNKKRQRQVPEAIILSMYRHLRDTPPQTKEGFDDLICVQEF